MSNPLGPYWFALGKFIHRYAAIELTLNVVLRISANVTHKKGAALFSGTRVSNAISQIKRLHEVDNKELSPWLQKAFPKINELTSARDEILHQGFELHADEESIVVSNKYRTIPRAAITRHYTVNDLDKMESDAIVAHACLQVWWLEQRYPKSKKQVHEDTKTAAQQAWRYTPPQPKRNRRKSPGTVQGR